MASCASCDQELSIEISSAFHVGFGKNSMNKWHDILLKFSNWDSKVKVPRIFLKQPNLAVHGMEVTIFFDLLL